MLRWLSCAALFFFACAQVYAPATSPSANVVPVPNGVFLGVAIPANATGLSCATIPACIAALESAIGRKFALHTTYWGFTDLANINSDARTVDDWNGGVNPRVPVIAWGCTQGGTTYYYSQIAQGTYDSTLDTIAAAVKAYPGPVMLAPGWEVNDNWSNAGGTPNNCHTYPGSSSSAPSVTGQEYTAAYRHIVLRFRADGVTNVSWIYNPTMSIGQAGSRPSALYAGSDVVDWIACDPYDTNGSKSGAFSGCYTYFQNYGKPIMIRETGEPNCNASPTQPQFLSDVGANVGPGTTYSLIRAFLYWDSAASTDWHLDNACGGIPALQTLGAAAGWSPAVP